MKLFNDEDYNKSKNNDLLPFQCECCNNTFFKTKRKIQQEGLSTKHRFCSIECKNEFKYKNSSEYVYCKHCGTYFKKINSQNKRSKSGNHFCSQSCAAIYNNTHKTKGTRRSKLEQYLEHKLNELYPQLEILFNDKTAINSELDIYIPSLKLAFELNGIFHYEPIFGESKLNSIQQNDANKFQKCQEHGISLCIIDTSSQKYFKEQSSIKFLNIIKNIIDKLQ